VLNIVNLAHGALIMLGAYVCYYFFTGLGWDPFAALPVAMSLLFCLGYLIQRWVLNLVIRAPMFNSLLVTFGLEVVITYLAQLLFSADFRTVNPSYAGANFSFFGATVPWVRVLAFGVALALTFALWLFLDHTRIGRAIRATAQNLVAARLYGVNPRQLYALTFGIGAALAGAAFAIAIIGGLEKSLYVLVGGLFLGVVEALTALYIGPTYTDVVSFGILVLVLIVRPTGLLGRTA